VPNRAARQLAGGRTAKVAMLVPDITNPFFSSIVQAAQRRAGAAGRLLLLADTAQDARTELDAVRSLAPNVDGLVLCAPVAPTADLRRVARDRPLVFVNRRARGVPSVVIDQTAVVDLAIGHLRALGHRRIAAIRGPAGYWSSRQREQALRRLGAALVVLDPVDPTFEGGQAALARVVESGATAVLAFNDVTALGLVAAASAAGLVVPEQLSVVGADGVPYAAMATPALTTVAVDLEVVGDLALADLLARIDGTEPDRSEQLITPHLTIRASTAPPRRRRP
jgi:DNA-binding LacI/PurR family transcriptional regulator